MHVEPLTTLGWAYQLHYYLCFRIYLRHKFFATEQSGASISSAIEEISRRHEYRLLKIRAYPDNLRCLISLRPEQDIATVIRTIKANSSREYCAAANSTPPLWARGYLPRSVGRVRIEPVRLYLQLQAEHHGYARQILPPVYRYRAEQPVQLSAAHSSFELNHHVVLVTNRRAGIFGSRIGEALARYWRRVGAKRGFAIDQMTFVPDHVHLLTRTAPKMSVEECVPSLMNNGQHFIATTFPDALIRAKVDQLWQPSAFAGTRGKMTTALLKVFLSRD